ncbi:MAG TPA: AI-2E family transporter [Chakrabartia sp.]|nr:AI-2E family transporter [Chakrabartia sp.]
MRQLEDRFFLGFIAVATAAMAWIAMPFFGAILWALVAAIVFKPVHRRLAAMMPRRHTTPALITLILLIAIVIIPAVMLGSLLIDQAISIYNSIETRQLDLIKLMRDVQNGLPDWMQDALSRISPKDVAALQGRLASTLTDAVKLGAGQAVSVGQGALSFVMQLGIMLYLAFFLIRDGDLLTRKISLRLPLDRHKRRDLFNKFTTVIRATVKGSFVVAIVQGALGGIIFAVLGINAALLWGVIMGMFSLVPAIGTGIVWLPVSIYLLATGQQWQAFVLAGFGVLVIGMVDNVLRPILVGKDTRMPDWVVLIATLGGLSVFGMNGVVVGPVIAAMFIAAWDIFADEREVLAA